MVSGFNVNLTKVQIAERRVTPPLMVTCSLENVMPAFVGESNLGPKFVIPGSAYSSTVEDTLQVVNTTYNCDTEPVQMKMNMRSRYIPLNLLAVHQNEMANMQWYQGVCKAF